MFKFHEEIREIKKEEKLSGYDPDKRINQIVKAAQDQADLEWEKLANFDPDRRL